MSFGIYQRKTVGFLAAALLLTSVGFAGDTQKPFMQKAEDEDARHYLLLYLKLAEYF